jgi:lambda repressor-like predicted transcriptional regulator
MQIQTLYPAMIEMWKAGKSMRAVATHFGVDPKTVDRALSQPVRK